MFVTAVGEAPAGDETMVAVGAAQIFGSFSRLSRAAGEALASLAEVHAGHIFGSPLVVRSIRTFFHGVSYLFCAGALLLLARRVSRVFFGVSTPQPTNHDRALQFFSQQFHSLYERERNEELWIPLQERSTVSMLFADDEVLGRYKCPLARVLIRHPVIDPSSGILYEREAIETWIRMFHRSPTTSAPLEKESLKIASEAQEAIDGRLRVFQGQREASRGRIVARLEQARALNGSQF